MNVIFGKSNAEMLQTRYLILELETFNAGGRPLECFCLVDFNSVPTTELPLLDHYKKLHTNFVENLKNQNYAVCRDLIPHLSGKFGGELDSFYQVVGERIQKV